MPVMGFAAPSGTGKTTLMAGVIEALSQAGFNTAALKHGHHPADPDVPGKDTHRFRQAGAQTVIFASSERWFLIQDLKEQPEPSLNDLTQHLGGHDLILVEGYKNDDHPKILIHRAGVTPAKGIPPLTNVVAIATDDPQLEADRPRLALNDPQEVAAFIQKFLGLKKPA
ncbi:MAG: molybdopterin-guanine dinucleotide biosynthesis protein B [Magnetococcales bacterium]|nr:molybdopterin-guanine dinucleotide biosynthesis protein B [Magnetococcales bacterium]